MHPNDEDKDASRAWRGGFQGAKMAQLVGWRLLVAIFLIALIIAAGGLAFIRVIIAWVLPGFDAF